MLIKAVLSDIGGVLLTNGWGSQSRKEACSLFEIDEIDFGLRHATYYPLHEEGKLSLDDYLDRVVFYRHRPFSRQQFLEFIYSQSQLLPQMLEGMIQAKQLYGFRTLAVSNEGRELALYRATHFGLDRLFDGYLVSSSIAKRKPEPAFYQLALDLVGCLPEEVVYIDDRPLFIEEAERIGLLAYHHSEALATLQRLQGLFDQ